MLKLYTKAGICWLRRLLEPYLDYDPQSLITRPSRDVLCCTIPGWSVGYMPQIAAYHKKLLQSHLVNKSLCLWLMTAEVYVEGHRVLVTALLKKLVAELV